MQLPGQWSFQIGLPELALPAVAVQKRKIYPVTVVLLAMQASLGEQPTKIVHRLQELSFRRSIVRLSAFRFKVCNN